MLQGIDHVVILVADLDAAIEDCTRLGFTAVPGGRHRVATHNALIGFQDGAYLELIAFWEDDLTHRWRRFLALGGGLVDYCMRTDDLAGDVAALRAMGIAMSEDFPMSRLRPDGYRIEWKLALAPETQGVTPFLIEDITPREERLPGRTEQANGVTGILGLTIAVPDIALPRRLASLSGADVQPLERGEIGGHGLRLLIGGHSFDYVTPRGDGATADFVSSRGGEGGIFALSLRTLGPDAVIEPALAGNARISLVSALRAPSDATP